MPLSPSERVNIIDAVATRFSNESWTLIDLTLSQFDYPTNDIWNGSRYDYVIEMLKGSDDDALIGIAHHVGVDAENPEIRIDPPFWEGRLLRVFISHLAEHRKFAGLLQAEMLKYGMSGFVAHNDIEPTKEWQSEIETALETCEVMVALLHEGFGQSDWTDQEVGFAMGRSLPIFSVRFDEDPHGFIGRFQAFQGVEKSADVLAREIFDALRRNKAVQGRMAELLIMRFEGSGSFQDAKCNLVMLEEMEVWQKSYSDRVLKALDSNPQLAGAWGVPDRINALVEKWSNVGV